MKHQPSPSQSIYNNSLTRDINKASCWINFHHPKNVHMINCDSDSLLWQQNQDFGFCIFFSHQPNKSDAYGEAFD